MSVENRRSFYLVAKIRYQGTNFVSQEYRYHVLCPLHNYPLSGSSRLDAYLRFNTFCYTCPICPELLSTHFHPEGKPCDNPKCEPIRIIFRGEATPIQSRRFHHCRHHFFNNRIPISPLGHLMIPNHAHSPFFATEAALFAAGDHLYCATAPSISSYLEHLRNLENEEYLEGLQFLFDPETHELEDQTESKSPRLVEASESSPCSCCILM